MSADILHDFPIDAPPDPVFHAVTSPEGLDRWWTLSSSGTPDAVSEYALDFGPGYHWQARVSQVEWPRTIEWTMTAADADWTGTTLSLVLEATPTGTSVRFAHRGWPEVNAHYRTSVYCWAMYLRLLKRLVEHGEWVPYASRLNV